MRVEFQKRLERSNGIYTHIHARAHTTHPHIHKYTHTLRFGSNSQRENFTNVPTFWLTSRWNSKMSLKERKTGRTFGVRQVVVGSCCFFPPLSHIFLFFFFSFFFKLTQTQIVLCTDQFYYSSPRDRYVSPYWRQYQARNDNIVHVIGTIIESDVNLVRNETERNK